MPHHSHPLFHNWQQMKTKVRKLQEKIRQAMPKEHKLLDKLVAQRNSAFQKWYKAWRKKYPDNDN